MNIIKKTGIAIVVLVCLARGDIASAKPSVGDEDFFKHKHVQDEIIVKYKGDQRSFQRIKIPGGKVKEKVYEYLARDDVDYAEPNYVARALLVPNDPYYRYQWNFDNPEYGGTHTEKAWDGSAGSGVVVAVVDTGVAYENYQQSRRSRYYQAPDLANTCFVAGYDFVSNDSHPNDDNAHGTHVAGTIAQSTNNSIGVAGIAFQACLMPVKVLDRYGYGTYADIAEGIRWAADHGADVVNLSLGGPADSAVLEEAVAYAYTKGVVVVAAAGNDGGSGRIYPASYDDYVMSVGATQYNESLAPYSNYGAGVDVVAPGGNLGVDQNSDGFIDGILQNTFNPNIRRVDEFAYWFFQGTSMAAAHVAGVAAVVISHGVAATSDDVRAAVEATADDLGTTGRDSTFGWGLVNAAGALAWSPGPVDTVNDPPVANAGPDQTGTIGSPVHFDGSGSSDPDGTIVSYQWDFGDSEVGSGVTADHTYGASGTYEVTLTVTDDGGLVASDTAAVTIKEAPALDITIDRITARNTKLGERYNIRAYIKNNENKSYSVIGHLEITDPGGQKVSWQGMGDQQLTISPGGEGTIRWQSKIPTNATIGIYTAHVEISYQGTVLDRDQRTFTVSRN